MIRFFALFLAVGIATPAYALDFDDLMNDLEFFDKEVQWHVQEEVEAMEQHDFQESDELFLPVHENENDSADGMRKAVQNISVRINGIPVTFEDVPTDSWFAPYVRGAAESGIVSGYRDANGRLLGSFGPGDSVTIEQLAKMAVQASGISVQECADTPLNPAAVGTWSEEYISCAEHLGWAVYSDGAVDLYRPATRAEVVVTLMQTFSVSFGSSSGEVFDDVTASTEFSGAIEQAAIDGVVSGYADDEGNRTGLFGPSDPVQRAEVAKMVTLAKQIYGK